MKPNLTACRVRADVPAVAGEDSVILPLLKNKLSFSSGF
jgi:hypothetical protein